MGIIYPDNENRAKRVQTLVDNIVFIQTEITESIAAVDRSNARIKPTLDKILKDHGMKTIKELQDKVLAQLTPEQKASYEKLLKEFREEDSVSGDILDATLLITFISGIFRVGVTPVITMINTGAFVAGFDLVGRGLLKALAGEAEAGAQMMRAGVRTAKALQEGVELTSDAARFTKLARVFSEALLKFMVVVDGIILIIQAIVGAEQKAKLQEATKDLFARRLSVKYTSQFIKSDVTFAGSVEGYLATYDALKSTGQDEAEIKKVLGLLETKMVAAIQSDQKDITYKSVYDVLHKQDGDAKSWVDEDPTFDQAMKQIEDDNKN